VGFYFSMDQCFKDTPPRYGESICSSQQKKVKRVLVCSQESIQQWLHLLKMG
jgi:hypothetical protein